MAKGDNIKEQLIAFAIQIINLAGKLPHDIAGKHIAGQLLRSGTSPAANYAEARSAESPRDFVHKVRIALKKMNETLIWLKIITRSELYTGDKTASLMDECDQLCRILSASIKTASKRIRN